VLLTALGLTVLAGCASVRPQAAFEPVARDVERRAGARVVWATGADEDAEAASAVRQLLADSLTAEAAVQIALLNNRRLQATFEDLGVAQASLVQAGLLANPVFGGGARWPLDGGAPDLSASVALEFLDVFYVPLRRRVARSQFEAAQARATGAVLDLAARTRVAYARAQTDAARLALQRRVAESARAGYEAARLLREAGNVPAVDLLAEQARYEQARLDVVAALGRAGESRERLVRLMGVYGEATRLRLAGALPPVPAADPLLGPAPAMADPVLVDAREGLRDGVALSAAGVDALVEQALAASLDLEAARLDVVAYGQRLGLATPESLLPAIDAGAEAEREEGEWKLGPDVEVRLPLFDAGQARRGAARAELRRRQALYYATGVEVRSAARTLAQRLATAHQAALHYQTVVLPLRAELTAQSLRQYNAMQTGVFGLLQAQQMEIDAGLRYLDTLADYWTARAETDLLLQGRMPDLDADRLGAADGGGLPVQDPGH
jgi:cobalt-zinc-cadmium efflux system outer membrane protein